MGVNKVDLSTGETLIDISNDTVTPETLAQGVTAHNSNGDPIVGTMAAGEGGSGGSSGIIDVTELPTTNIDVNAVYRVTESVQTDKTEVYVRTYINGSYIVFTAQQYLASLGVSTVPNIYVVDELSNLKTSDLQYYTEINAYILRSDGICYLNAPIYGGIITLGLIGFQAMGYDKGFTDNAYTETESGIYTTLEAYKEVIRYFIRKSGKWEEISATMSETRQTGLTVLDVLAGEYPASNVTISQNGTSFDVRDLILNERTIPSTITVKVPSTGDIIRSSTADVHISKEYFRESSGRFISNIRQYAFVNHSGIISVDMPDTITYINSNAFNGCNRLENVTLSKNITVIPSRAFYNCQALSSIIIPQGVISLEDEAFYGCVNLSSVSLPSSLRYVNNRVFAFSALTSVTFKGKCEMINSNAFSGCSNLTTINVPWSEGEVLSAPWGATNATINYNYTEG